MNQSVILTLILNQKKGASNEKVDKVRDALGSDEGAYFVPVLDTIPQDVIEKVSQLQMNNLWSS